MPQGNANQSTRPNDTVVDAWLPTIIPTLKTLWGEQTVNVPQQPPPTLSDWLTLLHVAATAPAKISTYLQPLLPGDHHHIQPQECWETLTHLFALTARAAQAHADELNAEAWQSLLTIQNRVLQATAATIAAAKPGLHQTALPASGQAETGQLQDILQRHLREQTILYESNITLGSTLDQEKILRLMSRAIAEAMEAGACVISEIDSNLQTVNQLAEYEVRRPGEPEMTWRTLRPSIPIADDPIAKQSLQTNRPTIHKADGNQIQPWQVSGDGSSTAHWGTMLALPIEIPSGSDGLVEIYDHRPNRNFSADDIQLGQILTTQTTLALERARLFDETRQRLSEVSTLYTMAQKIAGNLNLQEVMDAIVTGLRQVIGCRGCCIFLLDPATNLLKIEAADGLKPEWREAAKLQIGEGITGRAVAEGNTIYLGDTHEDPDFIFFDREVRSLMAAPLWAHGEIIGAINVDHLNAHAFGASQEQLLTIAAAQVGVTIENARLFSKISTDQQQTQAIIQHVADGLLVIDQNGVITTCNPALTTMLGLSRSEIIGQNIGSPELHPNLAYVTASTKKLARTGVLAKEVSLTDPSSKILQIFSTTMIDENKIKIGEVRVVHDVTKERNLEQLKNDFMSTISHELRTPLFSIQGFVQILLDEEAELPPDTRREFLTTIHTQALQLSELVNNILDMARFDEGRLEFDQAEVNPLTLLQQVRVKLMGFAHQQKIELVDELPDTLPVIMGDAERLEQVMTNLIGNAIKFTPEGGQVHLGASATADELLVEVRDSGIGIPENALEQIFSRYYQVSDRHKRSSRGSGLGLHIASKIVEGHKGRIWAESKLGEGSTFWVSLPLK